MEESLDLEQSLDPQEEGLVDNIIVIDQDGGSGSYNYENEEFYAEEEDEDQHGEDVDEEDVSF